MSEPATVIEFGPRQGAVAVGTSPQPTAIPVPVGGEPAQVSGYDLNYNLTVRRNGLVLADEMIRFSERLDAGPRREKLMRDALEIVDNIVASPT